MALLAKDGSFNIGTGAATTTVSVTDVGFTPTVVFLFWGGRTEAVDTVGAASHQRGFGFFTSTEQRYVSTRSQDAVATTKCAKMQSNVNCVGTITTTGNTVDGLATFTSMDSGGFTLTINNQFTNDARIHYLALAGESITNVDIGTFNEPGATGNQSITDPGFQPTLVVFTSAGVDSDNNDTLAADSLIMVGAAAGITPIGAVLVGDGNNAVTTTVTLSYCTDAHCIALSNTAVTAIDAYASFVSFDSTGFTVNWGARTAAVRRVHYIAIRGPYAFIDNLLSQTDTTTTVTESGLGFNPLALMFFSAMNTESVSATSDTTDKWSMGVATSSTSQRSVGIVDKHASATGSIVSTSVEHNEFYANQTAAGALVALMDVTGLTNDGFTAKNSDADTANNFIWYLALGDGPGKRRLSLLGAGH